MYSYCPFWYISRCSALLPILSAMLQFWHHAPCSNYGPVPVVSCSNCVLLPLWHPQISRAISPRIFLLGLKLVKPIWSQKGSYWDPRRTGLGTAPKHLNCAAASQCHVVNAMNLALQDCTGYCFLLSKQQSHFYLPYQNWDFLAVFFLVAASSSWVEVGLEALLCSFHAVSALGKPEKRA